MPWRAQPQYGSGSIADLLPSICDGLRVPGGWDHLALGEHSRVVLLVIDGLGMEQLGRHSDLAPFLATHATRQLTSVFPTTTSAALTSLGTGLAPGQHGLVGASFRWPASGAVLYPLSWRDEPPAHAVQPEPTWWERAARSGVDAHAVSPRAYRRGGLTAASLAGARYSGADGPGERIAAVVEAAASGGRSLVYAYWDALDRTAHMRGPESPHYRQELVQADAFAARLESSLPAGTRLVITADHGMRECPRVIDIDLVPEMAQGVALVAGEPRMRHVYVTPGRRDEVLAVWRAQLAAAAEVMTREQAIDEGLFGPVSDDVVPRIGEVLALAQGDVRLACPHRDSTVSGLLGQHGSLTPEELMVPLAVIDL